MTDPRKPVKDSQNYKDALVECAQFEERVASQLAALAHDLEEQGYPSFADAIQQACHRHRAASIKSRALASSLEG